MKGFSERVILIARAIPFGKVTTYGRIARAAGGSPMTSQSITGILSRAYDEGITDIPFHRIVYSDGHVWMNEEYRAKRLRLYKKEGIKIKDDRIQNFRDVLWDLKRNDA